jgi:hypothetical protein
MTVAAINFDVAAYADTLRAFGNSMRTAEGKGDAFARNALAALVTGDMDTLTLAASVYDEMKPLNAKGKLAEPKETEKGVSVSSLRSAKGGEGARSTLEAIFYVNANMAVAGVVELASAFILNAKGSLKLFPLKAAVAKLRLEAAKAAAPEGEGEREGDEKGEGEGEGVATPIGAALAYIATLEGEALAAAGDEIAALLKACRDASARLAAVETLAKAA